MKSMPNKLLINIGTSCLSNDDMDSLIHEISRIVADGNILMQTGRVISEQKYEDIKKEILAYDPA